MSKAIRVSTFIISYVVVAHDYLISPVPKKQAFANGNLCP